MRGWDIGGSAARLEEAYETLQRAWRDVSQHWNDRASEDFRVQYLDPLAPGMRRALDAIGRVDEVFTRAHAALADRDREGDAAV